MRILKVVFKRLIDVLFSLFGLIVFCLRATVGSMTQAAMRLGLCNSKNDSIRIGSLRHLILMLSVGISVSSVILPHKTLGIGILIT